MMKEVQFFMGAFKRDNLSSQTGAVEEKEKFTRKVKGILFPGKKQQVQKPTGKRRCAVWVTTDSLKWQP